MVSDIVIRILDGFVLRCSEYKRSTVVVYHQSVEVTIKHRIHHHQGFFLLSCARLKMFVITKRKQTRGQDTPPHKSFK